MSNRVRWLVVIVPALIVGMIELLSDEFVDRALPFPLDTLLVVGATLVLAGIFATLAFRRIDALTGALRRRNEELEARATSARALHRVSVAIASLTDVERVLDAIVTHARELLGVDGVCVISHGSSSAHAIVNATRVAESCVRADVVGRLRGVMAAAG